MPELPEVETIRKGLESCVIGGRVKEISFGDPKILQVSSKSLRQKIRGQTVRRLDRRGKFLIIELDTNYLIFHFGMTGQLTFRDPNRTDTEKFKRHSVTGLQRAVQHAPDRHTHLQIHFSQGGAMLFRDVRKFGKVFLLEKKETVRSEFFGKLGLEPFTEQYNLDAFLQKFNNRKLRLKSLLLDQRFVAGVGNIYADESLFESAIHPSRSTQSLRRVEKVRLFNSIPLVLQRGIQYGGTSFRDYVNSQGERGSQQERLLVYGRQGKGCYRCDNQIQKTVISQRGTHFCPSCQPQRLQRRGITG